MRNVVRNNIFANYIGSIWIGLVGVAFIPIYISMMGVESYGLVGIYLSLQALFIVVDAGVSPSVSREIARINQEKLDDDIATIFVCSLERLYSSILLFAAILVFVLSDYISGSTLTYSSLNNESVTSAVRLMGFVAALRWMSSFYKGALIGLQKQVSMNLILAIFATFRGVGVIVFMLVWESTIVAFFLWFLVGYFFECIVLRVRVKTLMMTRWLTRFSWSALAPIWRFAAGVTVLNIVSVIIMQADKVALIQLYPLREMGYYTVSVSLCSVIVFLAAPVYNSVFPRYSELVKANDWKKIESEYSVTAHLLSCFLVPVCLVISVFSYTILYLWTGDVSVANQASGILSVMVCGALLNAMMMIPFALQLAMGWTKLALTLNAIIMVVGVPLMWWRMKADGPIVGAFFWFGLNLFNAVLGTFIMHRVVLKGFFTRWIFNVMLVPIFISFSVCFIVWNLTDRRTESIDYYSCLYLGVSLVLSALFCVLVSKPARSVLIREIRSCIG